MEKPKLSRFESEESKTKSGEINFENSKKSIPLIRRMNYNENS